MVVRVKRVAAPDLKPPITVEQWGELERPSHYELVNGFLWEKPPVAFWHEIGISRLLRILANYAVAMQIGEFVCSNANLKISTFHGRQPDIFFVPKEQFHLVGKNLFLGVPPLAVEFLSPNNEATDRLDKPREYAELGIGQYWIVDCPIRRIEVYVLANPNNGKRAYELAETIEGDAIFRPALFPGLEIPLKEIWPNEFINNTDE